MMYQSIDEPIEGDGDDIASETSRSHLWLGLAVLGGIFLLAGTTYFLGPHNRPTHIEDPALVAERQDYLAALGENDMALRRARLMDFVTTYPNSQSRTAASAQLDVLNDVESTDWSRLSDVIYNPDILREDKERALQAYSQVWGPSLLGGRQDDLERMRNKLETDIEPIVDETLDTPDFSPGSDQFSENIPNDTMAGAAITRPVGDYVRPQPAITPVARKARIIEPKIRKNSVPKYPMRAMRREIEAVVTLSLDIDSNGDVTVTELLDIQARRYERDFIRAAERAALRTRFFPKTVDGQPVATKGVIKRYRFQLN